MKTLRKVQEQQDKILDKNNELKLGVFDNYFKEFNLLNKKRILFKKLKNKNSLTEWQALEILHDNIFMLCAVFRFGPMNKSLIFFYDISSNELSNYSSQSFFSNPSFVAPKLTEKSLSTRTTNDTTLHIWNELEKNKIYLKGFSPNLKFDLSFERIATPSVVSIPMTKKHTVYTEKDLLVPKGGISHNNKNYQLNQSNITILDDHRGYYPLSSGYDWITCMGNLIHHNQSLKFGLNLTYFYKNLNPNEFNENGYWLDNKFYQLPVVTFERVENKWYIKDNEDFVNLCFTKKNEYKEFKKIGLKIDYTLAFGEVSGYIRISTNEKLEINQMFSLGEKRLTKLCWISPYK